MKKLSILFLCLFFTMGLIAQEAKGVLFEHGTFAEALAKAKKNKKGPNIIFMDCYTTWCGPCKQMANVIFPMEHVGKFFNANFVNVKIDMEKGEGIELAKKYGIRAYPTFLILDSDGNEINRIVGSGDADSFIAKAKKAMDPNNNPKVLRAAYDSNKNAENAIAYLDALKASYLNSELAAFVDEIFPTLTPRDRYSDKMWPYVTQMLQNPNSVVFAQVMDDKITADAFVTREKVDAAISTGLKNYTMNFVSGRIPNANNEKVLATINSLTMLTVEDESIRFYVNTAKYYAKNDFDAIAGLLKIDFLMRLSENDRTSAERIVMSVKGLPKEKSLEYLKSKADFYKKQAELSEDLYKKTAERMTAASAASTK